MNSIKENPQTRVRIHRIAAGLVTMLAGAIGLCAASPAAFAVTLPPSSGGPVGSTPTPGQIVVMSGMPGWQIALIAVIAALVASGAAVIVDRARSARRRLAPAS